MKKDKALGHDPLAWIKATKETETKQADEAPKTEEQVTYRVEIPSPEIKKSDEVKDAAVKETREARTLEIPQPVQRETGPKQERMVFIPEPGGDKPKPSYTTTMMGDTTAAPRQRESQGSSLIFIIAYAFLLLIMTFFVYFSLSSRIDALNSKISNLENALNVSSGERGTRR